MSYLGAPKANCSVTERRENWECPACHTLLDAEPGATLCKCGAVLYLTRQVQYTHRAQLVSESDAEALREEIDFGIVGGLDGLLRGNHVRTPGTPTD